MKSIKIIIMVLSLSVMNHFASAQNCQQGKVLMSKGYKGHCGCKCQKKCVPSSEVQAYLNDGWYLGECINLAYFCCWVRNGKTEENIETKLANIQSDSASESFTISFTLQKQSIVNLSVFDMNGRFVATVANKIFTENNNEVTWDAGKLNTGIYYLKMTAGDYNVNRKISVIN